MAREENRTYMESCTNSRIWRRNKWFGKTAVISSASPVFGLVISREDRMTFSSHINILLGSTITLQIPSQLSQVAVDEFSTHAFVVGGWPKLLVRASPERTSHVDPTTTSGWDNDETRANPIARSNTRLSPHKD